MNKKNPKVSIVIPVYNGSNYLKDAIDSALSQTYNNLEIIVVNDGSNDEGKTKAIAESYGDKIIYLVKENGGASSALNLAIKKMTGDYFSWLSHDDMYYPNKISRQVEELQKYNDKTILFSNYDYINPEGNKIKSVYLNHKLLQEKPDYAVLKSNIGGITLLIPKEAFEEYGEFDLTMRCTQDYDMWFRMLNSYTFVHMEDILAMTRIHSLQDSNTSPRMLIEGNKLWIDIYKDYPLEKKIALEGSEYAFYKEMENFLSTTSPYNQAAEEIGNIAKKVLEKDRQKLKDTTITVIVVGTDNEKTISSLEKQTFKNVEIVIEKNISERNKLLKEIKTDYHTFISAGEEVKENWLEEQLLTALASEKSLIISDLNRVNKDSISDNIAAIFITLDGVIFKSKYNIEYKDLYQYIYEHYKKAGLIVSEECYYKNLVRNYNMTEVYDMYKKIINEENLSEYEIASISYDLTCLYNKNTKTDKQVYMYERCNELQELMFSRSFRLLKSYIDRKRKRKHERREKGKM